MLAETTGAIDIRNNNGALLVSGKDCFGTFFRRLERKYSKQNSNSPENLNTIYIGFYDSYQSDLGHYFRSLYHIVKLVDQTDFVDQRRYTNLIRAQLSTYELTLLFYNCLSDLGVQKFKPRIEKYALLKNLPTEKLLDEHHVELYEKSAM